MKYFLAAIIATWTTLIYVWGGTTALIGILVYWVAVAYLHHQEQREERP